MALLSSKPQSQPKASDQDEGGPIQASLAESAHAPDPLAGSSKCGSFGSDLGPLKRRFARDVIGALWVPEGASPEDRKSMINGALLMFARLDPRDEAEAMLCVQMVASYNAAMECHRRAMLPDQIFEGRDMALKHAAKMSALYEKQLAAYDKRRGKRNQTVVVKHVTVEPGAQAIVGDVHTHSSGEVGEPSKPSAGALEHRNDDALCVEVDEQNVPSQAREG